MSAVIQEKLKILQSAINYEIDQHYINAKGKKNTFSNFIIQNAKTLSSVLNDKNQLKSLINLFYAYPVQDITARMYTIHKAQEILKEISDKNKRSSIETPQRGVSMTNKTFEKDPKKIDVKYVKGVGPKMSLVLNRLGIFSVNDLFQYYPRTYIDYQKQLPIKDLRLDDSVTICGTIKSIKAYNPPKRKDLTIFTICVEDGTGRINITKFIAGKFGRIILAQYKKQYPVGAKVVCSGTVSFDKYSRSFSLTYPAIEVIYKDHSEDESLNTSRIVPVYALTEGITEEFVRKIVSNGFKSYGSLIQETLPKKIIKDEKLLDLKTSLAQIHFPESQQLCEFARNRIVFEEFFLMQLQLAYRRRLIDKNRTGLCLKEKEGGILEKLIKSLPFELTNAQKRVFNEIKSDLMNSKPMHRLLQGDVGSGKTIVALMTLLFALENGYQTALMAPTEILVNQHLRRFQEYLNPLGIEVALLTGSTPNKLKTEIYQGLSNGQIKIVVGTHALIQEDVRFNNLGLVVIDEQHRFGVKQRDALLQKGKNIERLFMTATPIPRTLALALHGDLELSEINELPKGRIPIKTSTIQPMQRQKAFHLICGEVAKGRQAYIVFPLIDESEKLSAKAATIEFEELSKTVFKDLKVGLMHGELPTADKEKVMKLFVNNEINVLVTTTVIEVGVDVQNATVMMIENAERFGLSQLHQLRGRVGRGREQAYCLLAPQSYSDEAMKRLSIMTQTNDGFIISQEDLRIRGPGEFLGIKQSGLPDLRLADLIGDAEVLDLARKKAIQIIEEDPLLDGYPELRQLVSEKSETYVTAG
ncbi:MAG: ATP-dependent DNA helicase RecG [Candidatus Melainabacteria bacterium RIFCSPLOWO2_12_FULL_35_11]|nr:MAG: ATP-dependent DNA helicase RecG [Candidatus Melainabacteria bacterium RIFCSPLOWO2_12_FULL_35_11]